MLNLEDLPLDLFLHPHLGNHHRGTGVGCKGGSLGIVLRNSGSHPP